MNSLWKSLSVLSNIKPIPFTQTFSLVDYFLPKRFKTTLQFLRNRNLNRLANPKKKKECPLGKPFAKGLVLRCVVRKPRKPNSANRKCVVVRLWNGKEVIAYVPGIGHNLQEHQYVLLKNSNLKDVPGVKVKCVRGKYDLPHVVKRQD